MKSLNRTLALVLVLVMVFGLFGVASASSSTFTDAASVGAAYAEAVDVLTGIGAVNGATATTLDPTGSYTREQAAKVIAYVSLGKTTAEALACSVAPFSDVAADRWSAGYIQYAVSQGIINGLGDGSFNPTGALTGYQFAKMLLCALGYGKAGEYTGTGWEIAVAKDALGLKIFKGDTTAATNAKISRQQAMLMAFNAMFLGTVKAKYAYDNGVKYVSEYTTGGASFAATVYGYDAAVTVPTTTTLVKKPATVNGAVGYYWYYKGTSLPVTAFYTAQTVIGSSTNGNTIATLSTYSTTNAYYIADLNSATFYVNGSAVADQAAAEAVNGRGVKVEFVDTDNDTDTAEKVFVTTYRVDVVAAAPVVFNNPSNGKDYIFIDMGTDIGVSTTSYDVKAANVTGYAGLVKGDVVLVYADSASPVNYSIVKASSFVGAATASSGTSLTIGGTVYKAAKSATTSITSFPAANFLANVNFYTDTYGYLVYAKAVTAVSTDYLYVLESAAYSDTTFLSGTNKSAVVFKDASTATITVASVDGKDFATYGSAMTKPAVGDVFAYIKNADGTYALISATELRSTAGTTTADADGAFTKGASAVDCAVGTANDLKTDASTVYVARNIKTAGTHSVDYVSSTAPATGTAWQNLGTTYYTTWTAYTGFANMFTSTAAQYIAVNGTDGYADIVFVTNYLTTSTSTSSVIYLLSTTATAVYKSASVVDYYTFPAIVDGVKTTVKAPAAISGSIEALNGAHALGADYYVADGTLLAVTYFSDGKLSGLLPVTSFTLGNAATKGSLLGNFLYGTTITAPENGIIEIGGVGYGYTATTVVFYISADKSTVTLGTASGLASASTHVVISAVTEAAGVTSATDAQKNTLKAIFVQAS